MRQLENYHRKKSSGTVTEQQSDVALNSYFALQKSRSGEVPSMMQCFPETTDSVTPVLPDISLKKAIGKPRS